MSTEPNKGDIVGRLEDYATYEGPKNQWHENGIDNLARDCRNAAATIRALRSQVADLTAQRDNWIERAKDAIWTDSKELKHTKTTLASVTAQRDALRKAANKTLDQFEYMLGLMGEDLGSEFYIGAGPECVSRIEELRTALALCQPSPGAQPSKGSP